MNLAIGVFAGMVAGMLINYLADVLPDTRSFSRPACKVCARPYSVKEYLLFNHCLNCGSRVPSRRIVVLVSSIVGCLLLNYFPLATLGFWATLPIVIYLGVVLVIDIEHHAVLIQTSFFGIVLFLAYGTVINGLKMTALGALAGLAIMLVFFFFGLAFSKIIGAIRHKAIDEVVFGFGDVSLGTILGLLIGWPLIAGAVTIAIIVFEVFTFFFFISLLVSKKYHAFASALPFTPFLILGAVVILYL
jgi:hypothetical protein